MVHVLVEHVISLCFIPNRIISSRCSSCCIICRSSITTKSIRSKSFTLSINFIIKRVEILSSGAVKIEPPVTDEIVLVEECTIRTEEAVLGQTSSSISCANMECLALSLGVSIVTSIHLAFTAESRFRNLSIDRVVFSGHAWNVRSKSSERVSSFISCISI